MENVIIIGGGPAGLSAGIYLARSGLKPLIFAGSPPGGQLMLTSEVENFPGYESILGADLIQKMRNQASRFGAKIIDQNINKVNLNISEKKVESEGKIYTSKSLIIAVGAKALWLEVPGEKELRGKGVSACATCDGFFFREKVVAVVGGGDTAMEEALTLAKFAKKVYIIHRRDSFRASKIMQERVFANPKIEVIWNSVVDSVLGKEKVEEVRLKVKNQKSKITIQNLKLDGVFIAIGHKPDTDIFKGQIEMDEKGYIITSSRIAMENLKFSK
ncbi:MAG: FAD-dependent oxidoreductase [Patescibacteria group bacterium]|nr:FAD-dependent oxidoreductase [Patescibacteria group bacterium]